MYEGWGCNFSGPRNTNNLSWNISHRGQEASCAVRSKGHEIASVHMRLDMGSLTSLTPLPGFCLPEPLTPLHGFCLPKLASVCL